MAFSGVGDAKGVCSFSRTAAYSLTGNGRSSIYVNACRTCIDDHIYEGEPSPSTALQIQ